MAKKIELWVSEDGQEHETEAKCLDYEDMLAYAPEPIEALSKIEGIPGVVKEAKYIVHSLWDLGYKVVKREVRRE